MSFPSSKSSNGYDRISGTTGLVCESSIGADTYFELGTYANNDNATPTKYYGASSNTAKFGNENDAFGIYARVTIPLTGPKKRVNCNKLYDLEIEKLKLEIERLKSINVNVNGGIANDEILFE